MNLKQEIKNHCFNACKELWPQKISDESQDLIEVTQSTKKEYGHYQCNAAMKLAKVVQSNPRDIAKKLVEQISLKAKEEIEKIEMAGPGFINFTLSKSYISKMANKQIADSNLGVNKLKPASTVVIDFSSPNIAKEMHVGHLRSTIIGDCIARTLEFMGYNVVRLNHIGDWGTQFGMLIAYLKANSYTQNLENLTLETLVKYYKASKLQFDSEVAFKKQAQLEVVALQGGAEESLKIWNKLCEISMRNYEDIYKTLDIELIARGESFYNPFLADTVSDLEKKGLVEISDGAKCVYLDGYTNREGEPLPLIIQKSDGGYNYATTDITALRHRVDEESGDWLIYVTDAGQTQHFSMVFSCAEKANYNNANTRLDHVPFGLVLKPDGKKFKTREGDTESLQKLINTAIEKAKLLLQERGSNLEEIEKTSKTLGINAIKYADLSNHRVSNYVFSYEKMLQFEGNTAAFLSYAYVRILSIKDKTAQAAAGEIAVTHPAEVDLVLLSLQFPEICSQFTIDLLPHRLTEYLYKLAEAFHSFFHQCRVEGSKEQSSRIAICELTRRVMECGFNLLGLNTLKRM